MQAFLTTIVSFPTIVFTFALLIALLYWLVVIFGALDLDFLDSALGLDSVAGALDTVDGAAEATIDGAAEAAELDIDGNTGAEKANIFAGLLHSMGVRGVPITIVFTFVVFWAWVVSYLAARFLGATAATVLASLAVAGTSVLAGLVGGALTTRPFRKLFITQSAPRRAALVGKMCTVTSARVDGELGRAEIDDGAAGFVAEVRCPQENDLKRGSKALVYRYEPADGVFFIGPVDAVLDEAAQLTEKERSPIS